MITVEPVRRSGIPLPKRAGVMPTLSFLAAVGLIFARRPDLLLHAQMWAEDGHVYYQDVYNLGLKRTIILPQAGYFQTFSVLGAWISRFFALTAAPLVMALIALIVQALPVGLLATRRAKSIAPDIRVRMIIALAYLLLPTEIELDATLVNAQWFLAIAATIVLMLDPPRHRGARGGDAVILLASGLTGPFAIVLAPIAWIRRFSRGKSAVPTWEPLLLTACLALQVLAIGVISHHDAHNPNVEARPSPSLGATPALFAQLVGGRVLLGTVIGESSGLEAAHALQWIALALALVMILALLRARRFDLIAYTALATFVLAGALINPSTGSPAWPELAAVPPGAQRYFYLPELAWTLIFLWAAVTARRVLLRVTFGAVVVAIVVVAAVGHWSFPAEQSSGFGKLARQFDAEPNGTVTDLPIEPSGWAIQLLKR